MLLWLAYTFPLAEEGGYLARLAHLLEPVFAPLGFDWRLNSALISALAAKEVFIAQMGLLFMAQGQSLAAILAARYSPATAVSLLLFLSISLPCLGSMAAVKQETGSWRFVALQLLLLTALAYLVSWGAALVMRFFAY